MRRRPLIALMGVGALLALLVGGLAFFLALHGPVGTPRSTVATSRGRNLTHDRLAASDTESRSELLTALVQQGGQTCPRVTLPIFQGFGPAKSAVWTVACAGGHTYQLVILADESGSIKITDCGGLLPGAIPCFRPLN